MKIAQPARAARAPVGALPALARLRDLACTIIAAAVLALAGCLAPPQPASDGPAASAATPIPPATMPSPFERVTDIAETALTPQQVKALADECQDAVEVPTEEASCPFVSRMEEFCRQLSRCVIVFGRSAVNRDIGFVRIRDDRPGSPACRDGNPLCTGVAVSAKTIDQLAQARSGGRGDPTTDDTASPTPPEPTPTSTATAGPRPPWLPRTPVVPTSTPKVAPVRP
ncbi:MAG TPA: hypothetical protein VFM55_08110 [Micromonosporaceae bacterium]|nr:hypothetical protein [Micromonosporaceae bacterium]